MARTNTTKYLTLSVAVQLLAFACFDDTRIVGRIAASPGTGGVTDVVNAQAGNQTTGGVDTRSTTGVANTTLDGGSSANASGQGGAQAANQGGTHASSTTGSTTLGGASAGGASSAAGVGGALTGTGGAGAGGSCGADTIQVSSLLLTPDSFPYYPPLNGQLTTSVNVTGVDNCDVVSCTCAGPNCSAAPTGARTRILLADTASQQQWMLLIAIPDLPADLVTVGAAFDLDVNSTTDQTPPNTLNQTVVLARGGGLVLFGSFLSSLDFGTDLVRGPNLDKYGISITRGDAVCKGSTLSDGCSPEHYDVLVGFAGQTAVGAPGQTIHVGKLSVSVGAFENFLPPLGGSGGCPDKPHSLTGGFMSP